MSAWLGRLLENPLFVFFAWILLSVLLLLLLLLLVGWATRWLRQKLERWLPAGVSPIAFTWPLGTVLLIGIVATLVALVLRARTIDVPTIIVGVGVSLIATAIAGMVLAGREATLARIRDSGLVYVWANRMGRAPREQQAIHWVNEIYKARTSCVLVGTSLSGYSVHDRAAFERAVRQLISTVKFTLLLLDPESPAADIREEEEERLGEHTKLRTWTSIEALLKLREALGEAKTKFEIRLYSDLPTFALSWIDGYMIVTHYLPGIKNANCPAYALWDLHPFKANEGQLYYMFAENVDQIKERTKLIADGNRQEYLDKARRYIDEHEAQMRQLRQRQADPPAAGAAEAGGGR
jgi:hypothetical protein